MITPLLVAGFAMGFFGSPHCLGMCGGLVTAFGLSMQEVSAGKKRALIATYHLGRLISYSILGVVAGIIGTAVLTPIMVGNNLPRILLGAILVFIGLNMLGLPFLSRLEKFGMGVWKKLSPLRQKVFPITTFLRALAAGLLWGFLPCGLVYGALLMAAVGNNVVSGAMVMFAFGLGTVPMLVATQETVGWLHKQIGRFRLRQLNGIIMMLSGIAVIFVPIAMKHLHGGHGHSAHGDHGAHGGHSAATAVHTGDHDARASHGEHQYSEHQLSGDQHSEHLEHMSDSQMPATSEHMDSTHALHAHEHAQHEMPVHHDIPTHQDMPVHHDKHTDTHLSEPQ